MKKFLILAILITLTGCSQNLGGGVVTKEFELAGERVLVGGEALLGGDELTADFKPETKLEKWGDETYLKVWSEETGDKTASQVGDKVVWNADSGNEYRFYTKTAEELDNEDGGFEYEIIFKEKPKTNVVTLKIETKDLDFFYQPELTQKEIDEGAERPENVVGSYAVYHSTKQGDYSQMGGKNYKAGKAFHIYRPLIIDAKGTEVWGELHIENGVLTITIPQDFLDKAVYPVIVDPTFGYTDVGESNSSGISNIEGYLATGASGTGDNIKIHGEAYSTSNGGVEIQGALYKDSDGDLIDNGTTETLLISDTSPAWRTLDFGTSPNLSAIDYHISYWSDATSPFGDDYFNISSDSGDSNDVSYLSGESYNSWPDPITWGDTTSDIYSIYATYTESGGGEATSTPSQVHDIFFFD